MRESGFDFLRGFLLRDPNTNISDAIHAKFVPDVLEQHGVDDRGELACPYCEPFFPREDLGLVSYQELAADFEGVAWGCRNCTGGFAVDITLDRERTLEDGMRWSMHMLSKEFSVQTRLWAKGPL